MHRHEDGAMDLAEMPDSGSYDSKQLKNADFRKLLTAPRTVNNPINTDLKQNSISSEYKNDQKSIPFAPDDKKSKSHKKHKHYHKDGKGGRHKNDPAKEAAMKYRDRAKERREGKIAVDESSSNKKEDDDDVDRDDYLKRTADYRAVAPNTESNTSALERRKTIIEESKYLGGDMEHTHLVKGLDYVLLQKTRQKIRYQDHVEDDLDQELAKIESKPIESALVKPAKIETSHEVSNPMVIRLIKVLSKEKPIQRNEFFMPGRMAFHVELDDELAESDVPATLYRSKLDLPAMGFPTSVPDGTSTNEIVIAKLTQILSYLRTGKRQMKKTRKNAKGEDLTISHYEPSSSNKSKAASLSIFDDAPEKYVPTVRHKDKDSQRDRTSSNKDRRKGDEKRSSRYFNSRNEEEEEPGFKSPLLFRNPEQPSSAAKIASTKESSATAKQSSSNKPNNSKANLDRLLKKCEVAGYDECYPGYMESYDAMGDDSDEETDMRAANQQRTLSRFDFETQEEYAEYLESNKEAITANKSAGQAKGNAGRNKLKRAGPKEDKAELDRQWTKIQSIMQNRYGEDKGPPSKIPR